MTLKIYKLFTMVRETRTTITIATTKTTASPPPSPPTTINLNKLDNYNTTIYFLDFHMKIDRTS